MDLISFVYVLKDFCLESLLSLVGGVEEKKLEVVTVV